jgi:hypothetical protein
MKKLKILFLSMLLPVFTVLISCIGCENEANDEKQLPPNHAKGKIIEIFGGCYHEAIWIEVELPEDIGSAGSWSPFDYEGEEPWVSYNNAIEVPYFSRLSGIPDSIPQIGMELYFKYKKYKPEEYSKTLFPVSQVACPDIYYLSTPPNLNRFVITEIIDYELKNK